MLNALLLVLCGSAAAFVAPLSQISRCNMKMAQNSNSFPRMTADHNAMNRRQTAAFLANLALAPMFAGQVFADDEYTTTKSGLKYKFLKRGNGGGKPVPGDLVAVRFKGRYGTNEFDNIFNTPEPLYYRVGGGNLLKGVDEAVLLMSSGDYVQMEIPGNLAFGKEGRKASAGKPRIPADATIDFELELIFVPGKDEEILELNGAGE